MFRRPWPRSQAKNFTFMGRSVAQTLIASEGTPACMRRYAPRELKGSGGGEEQPGVLAIGERGVSQAVEESALLSHGNVG